MELNHTIYMSSSHLIHHTLNHSNEPCSLVIHAVEVSSLGDKSPFVVFDPLIIFNFLLVLNIVAKHVFENAY